VTKASRRYPVSLLLCSVFFLSGVSGVLFETLWFRLLGLTLGSSFVASSIVLAAFMAGLAAGNAIAARRGGHIRRPLLAYVVAEVVIGVAGVAIVVLLPPLSGPLGRVFAHLIARPWLVDLLRIVTASSLLLVPTTAMGITLPLLANGAAGSDANFGRVLGRLYGWNTLGGMVGADKPRLEVFLDVSDRGFFIQVPQTLLAGAKLHSR